MLKKIAFVASIPAISVPIAVTSSRPVGEDISDLLNKEIPANPGQNVASTETTTSLNNHIPKQPKLEIKVAPPKPEPPSVGKVISSLKDKGYTRQSRDKLADFNPGRELRVGGNTGLGCHRIIFRGKNYLRLSEPSGTTSTIKWKGSTYFFEAGDHWGTPLACSTASLRKSNNQKIYEFEFVFRRGNSGLAEKIVVDKDKIFSQVIIYKKRDNSNDFKHTVGFQRHIIRNSQGAWTVANPTSNESWTDLDLETQTSQDKPIYYAVWLSDNKQQGNIFQNLGIKSRGEDKWFSILAKEEKTQDENKWLGHFISYSESSGTVEPSKMSNHYKYEAFRKIANMFDGFKGSWKQIEDFCEEYKDDDTSKKLSDDDQTRLREYCFKAPR